MPERFEYHFWVLFDSTTEIASQNLSHTQLQMAIHKMKKSDLKRFFIWTPTWEKWQSLFIFLSSDQKIFTKDTKSLISELIPENTHEFTLTKSLTDIQLEDERTNTKARSSYLSGHIFDSDNLTWSGSTPPKDLNFSKNLNLDYHRRAQRHQLKIEILLFSNNGKAFRSHSKNISLSGTVLADILPFEYYGTPIEIVIVNRHSKNSITSRVQLKAQTVGDSPASRLKFENMTEDQKKKLYGLLNEYISKQKNNSNQSA